MSNCSSWSVEQDDFLRKLLADRFTFAEAVVDFNKKFGTNFSRCALIGRAHRLKIKTTHGIRTKRAKKVVGNCGVIKRVRSVSLAPAPVPRPANIALLRDDERRTVVDPTSRRKTGDLCKWPTEVGECTEIAAIGAYCECHAKLAYRTMPTVKRNAVFTKKDEEWRSRL